jgi:hypothetical protein
VSDDELRALERAVSAGGGAAERVALARALARLGREDDAFDVLFPAIDDEAVRGELARFPAWTHDEADAGTTNHVDVAPLRGEPRLRWTVEGASELGWSLASPLGIVCLFGSVARVLDPRTGGVRYERPLAGRVRPPVVAGGVLLSFTGTTIVAIDLWSGETLHEHPIDAHDDVCFADDLLLAVGGDGNLLSAWRLRSPRQPPERLWQFRGRPLQYRRPVVAADRVVLGEARAAFAILERETGAVLRRESGHSPRIDARGLIMERDDGVFAPGPAGEPLWTARGYGPVRALTPAHVVVGSSDRRNVRIGLLDRATGASAGVLFRTTFDERVYPRAVVSCRDTVYVADVGLTIQALPTGAGKGWRFDSRAIAGAPVARLCPLTRRLYGATRDGTVFCLEESPHPSPPPLRGGGSAGD